MSFAVAGTVAIVGLSVAAGAGIAKFGMAYHGRRGRIAEQDAAKDQHKKMMRRYESLDTSNIYADVKNPFEQVKNPYDQLNTQFENVYEDMTVNQQQAQFEKQMVQQQQSNIMQGLKGAAGGSGIAALAQSMANQGQLQAQRAAASIGMQESQQQAMKAQGAQQARAMQQQAEQLKMEGAEETRRTRMKGAYQAQMTRLAGEEKSRGLEWQKTGTMLGMSQQRLAAANQARQQAKQQQMAAVGDLGSLGMQAAKMGAGGGGDKAWLESQEYQDWLASQE